MGFETADPAELSSLVNRLVDAWNQGDARAFAALFTPSAEYVTGAGEPIRGREAIAALVDRAVSAGQVSVVPGGPTLKCDATSGEITFAWSAGPRRGRITCACVRHESRWLIEALHNNEDGADPSD